MNHSDGASSVRRAGFHNQGVGKGMNIEELRINKQLLKEISKKKKMKKNGGISTNSMAGDYEN